jgi:transketolase
MIYDSNQISIDGDVSGWFTENIPGRFESYGWHVIRSVDGHNPEEIKIAIENAIQNSNQPSIICCNTVIGWGSPNKAGKETSHGAPLGDDEIELTRKKIGWKYEPFNIPDEYYSAWDAKSKGKELENEWRKKLNSYEKKYPELADEYKRRIKGQLPDNWDGIVKEHINSTIKKSESIASRKASQNTIEVYAKDLPEMIGGSADLTGSNLTNWSGSIIISKKNKNGNYISYGVREFAMSAINNGIALHKGFIPYSGTFLMFSEYARNALRMAALMKIQNIFVFTHDSIGLGEDGPTHQAVEQASTLRLMPNMSLWRPCDAVETAIAWQAAIERRDGPTSLLFSRQNLAHLNREESQLNNIKRGGYILYGDAKDPELIIIATGSEVEMAINVAMELSAQNKKIRVISMPSADVFDKQDEKYKETVLPSSCRSRVAIEAGVTDYWRKYIGLDGIALGVDSFGESAPAKNVFEYFGLTEKNLKKVISDYLSETKK